MEFLATGKTIKKQKRNLRQKNLFSLLKYVTACGNIIRQIRLILIILKVKNWNCWYEFLCKSRWNNVHVTFVLIENLWNFFNENSSAMRLSQRNHILINVFSLRRDNALFSEKPPVSVTLRSANTDRRVDALSSDAHSWAATNGKAEKRCRLFRGLQGVSRLNISTGADSNASILRIFLAKNESLASARKILSASNTLVVVPIK